MKNLAKIIITLIVWSFILTGAVLVTRLCIWFMSGLDVTSVLLGFGIILAIWLNIAAELYKGGKIFAKTYRIFKIKQARKHITKYGN